LADKYQLPVDDAASVFIFSHEQRDAVKSGRGPKITDLCVFWRCQNRFPAQTPIS
jgi:hypothetical protein